VADGGVLVVGRDHNAVASDACEGASGDRRMLGVLKAEAKETHKIDAGRGRFNFSVSFCPEPVLTIHRGVPYGPRKVR